MTHMIDIFGDDWFAELAAERDAKYVKVQSHPEFPELSIGNYTDAATYDNHWTKYTRTCRGLIWDNQTGTVLARPFAKFFNLGTPEAPQIGFDKELYWVGEKEDGSLGIFYIRPDGQIAVATRGSFNSEQALHATSILTDEQKAEAKRDIQRDQMTPLVEIVYPANRIVVDYGTRDELIPLGWVSIKHGHYAPPKNYTDPETLRDIVARPEVPNTEGFVVWTDWDTAVKIKFPSYVALHAIVTGLSEKAVWRVMSQDGNLAEKVDHYTEFVAALPDELQAWAHKMADQYLIKHTKVVDEAYSAYYTVLSEENAQEGEFNRGRFARNVQQVVPAHLRGLVFNILDGRSIHPKIWAMIEPKGLGERPRGGLLDEEV